MEKQLQEILNTLYEAEGLLEMALRRAPRNLETLAALAREKCFHAADLAAALQVTEAVKGEEKIETESVAAVHEPDVAEQLFVEKVAPKLAEKEPEFEPESEPTAVIQSERQEAAEQQEAALAEAPAETEAETEADDARLAAEAEFEQEEDADVEEEGEDTEAEEPVEEDPAPRAIPAKPRRPIATFFSINDKFRFRRELFGGSNPEWLDALALLETMNEMSEASDYLFDDLQWDPESLDVKAFMQILERYYNS